MVVDNSRATVLAHTRGATTWHRAYEDCADYGGFRPWACVPYRPQPNGKVESGVRYVARKALAGKRFCSWAHINSWLVRWATTIADQRVQRVLQLSVDHRAAT